MIVAELVGGPRCGELVALEWPVREVVIPGRRPINWFGPPSPPPLSPILEGVYLRRPTGNTYDWQGWRD